MNSIKILLAIDVNQLISTATEVASSGLPDSTIVGVILSIGAALIVYTFRQAWERRKLRKALITEVKQMEGLEKCATRISEISTDPSSRPLKQDDVPAPNSIPTIMYENNAGQVGLLGSFRNTAELKNVIEFYSKVIKYKSIMLDIRNEEASDVDQEDLYDDIGDLSQKREKIIKSESFDN